MAQGGGVGSFVGLGTTAVIAGTTEHAPATGELEKGTGLFFDVGKMEFVTDEPIQEFLNINPVLRADDLGEFFDSLSEELKGALGFVFPQSGILPELLQKLSDLLIDPPRTPGDPCLAAPPLLRDLLDVALGRVTGGIDEVARKVGGSVLDFLVPAFGTAEDLTRAVQGVLDDPITAALNLVLGQRGKIDCPVEGQLGVGASVVEASVRRIEEALAGVLA